MLSPESMAAAASLGDPALLARLRALGCACEAGAWVAAADAGCGPALTWLAEAGCPRPVRATPAACIYGTVLMLMLMIIELFDLN